MPTCCVRQDRAGAGLYGEGAVHPGDLPAQLPVGPRPPTGRVSRELLARWAAGAGPRSLNNHGSLAAVRPTTVQGGSAPPRLPAYHPLLAVVAGTGDVLMARLREGRANTARGAAHFLRETVGRVLRGASANSRCGPTAASTPTPWHGLPPDGCPLLLTIRQHATLVRRDTRGELDAHPLLGWRRTLKPPTSPSRVRRTPRRWAHRPKGEAHALLGRLQLSRFTDRDGDTLELEASSPRRD